MLNYQQEHHLSNLATALIFGITDKATISAWRKKYITGGKEALFQNEYLKKYLALVQEDEKKKQQQKKDREKSKLSEN